MTERLRILNALHVQLMGSEPPTDAVSLIKVRLDLDRWKRREKKERSKKRVRKWLTAGMISGEQ